MMDLSCGLGKDNELNKGPQAQFIRSQGLPSVLGYTHYEMCHTGIENSTKDNKAYT